MPIINAGQGGGSSSINDFEAYPADFSTADDVEITEGTLDTDTRLIIGVLRLDGGDGDG